ncbi:Gfo/Idh/MocA family oxidoreductase [Seonamhaeicola algicola]|uniref:Gfo/Idh/MocA family oxidoreductase n=2 Tax=Seonamhaeicola TaxID=1649495 RepID=A0A5C7AT25_9FLAO|nr:Gfo/Idh/MocA family oxidoreductase [Seonamhaeicola algicola]TXE11541.1 Gfo/Idh/MocA family oxidoreductase [Seonamhaeicola algicola]
METALPPNKTIKWGIIGCGNVTEIKSGPPYKLTEGFDLIAVMRRDEAKVKDYAKRHQIKKYYTNAEALINDTDVDAVYIATPPDTHKFYALKVAKAGKICCIEKPMTPSYKDSLVIYNTFKERNIPLFVAYYRRSLPRFKQIKTWIDNGAIGEIRHINWQQCKPASVLDKSGEYNWRTDANIAPGGYFDDLASHGLDLFTQLLGNIVNATGFATNQQGLYSAKDAVTASWLHSNGATGCASWNFASSLHLDDVTIYGSKGTINFAVFHEKPLVLTTASKTTSIEIENPKHIQQFHIEGMRNQLLYNNYKHPSTGKTALHTNWVMDKILGKI